MMSPAQEDEDATIDRNIADFVVHLVVRLGARTAFSLTGGMAMYLNNAAANHPTLRNVYCQHEQACVAAAEGYAKACDFQQPGLAIVTAGPGVTNTITSLCSAYGDSAPVIVLAGQVKTADIDRLGSRTHGAQEVHSRDIVTSCVKRFVRLSEETWLEELTSALAEAFTGRPGPVFIEIPLDVQNRLVRFRSSDIDAAAKAVRDRTVVDADCAAIQGLSDALDWLLGGKRPLIYLGNGCRVAGAEGAARRFIEARGVPFVTSWLAADQLSARHPLNFGAPGGLAPISANKILFAADRVLFLGARLDLLTTAFQPSDFGGQAERVIVDVDPVELSKFSDFDRTRTICADLAMLAAAVDLRPSRDEVRDAWVSVCRTLRKEALGDEAKRLKTSALNVYEVARRLSDWSAGKMIVTTGSGLAIEAFIRFFAPAPGARLHFGASLGAMGLGLPQALGAAFAADRQTACIEGDGGLMLNLQELATLSHYAPRGFVLFILNNDGYQSILASQQRHFGEIGGANRASGVLVPSYEKVAPAFGLDYRRVETQDDLDHLLTKLPSTARPVVVDLIVEPNESRGPTVRTVIGADGKPRSTSLEEISW
jgi:acetolactate synthase-1/2/3 large subunit